MSKLSSIPTQMTSIKLITALHSLITTNPGGIIPLLGLILSRMTAMVHFKLYLSLSMPSLPPSELSNFPELLSHFKSAFLNPHTAFPLKNTMRYLA
jgi:hypothetical protein